MKKNKKFKHWMAESGMSMYAFARVCCLSRTTIKNLVDGKRPHLKTVKKLVEMTRSMKNPVRLDMFKKIKGLRKRKC